MQFRGLSFVCIIALLRFSAGCAAQTEDVASSDSVVSQKSAFGLVNLAATVYYLVEGGSTDQDAQRFSQLKRYHLTDVPARVARWAFVSREFMKLYTLRIGKEYSYYDYLNDVEWQLNSTWGPGFSKKTADTTISGIRAMNQRWSKKHPELVGAIDRAVKQVNDGIATSKSWQACAPVDVISMPKPGGVVAAVGHDVAMIRLLIRLKWMRELYLVTDVNGFIWDRMKRLHPAVSNRVTFNHFEQLSKGLYRWNNAGSRYEQVDGPRAGNGELSRTDFHQIETASRKAAIDFSRSVPYGDPPWNRRCDD